MGLIVAVEAAEATGAATSCTPYNLGDTGPDGGKVFYVDGSGCHGLEAQPYDVGSDVGATSVETPAISQITGQPYDVGATSDNSYVGVYKTWSDAITTSAAYNTTTITNALSCSTSAYPTTPNCWHLPSKTELGYLYEQRSVVGGFSNTLYWSSTELDANFAWNQIFFNGNQNYYNKTITYLVRAVRAF
ncbi:MAG: DUF1566 domain-containing protein [Methyloglobulus sp.]|nr:DUF1566 domain-containing protein [Methyloglobulus sp.]